jgi:CFEM domain
MKPPSAAKQILFGLAIFSLLAGLINASPTSTASQSTATQPRVHVITTSCDVLSGSVSLNRELKRQTAPSLGDISGYNDLRVCAQGCLQNVYIYNWIGCPNYVCICRNFDTGITAVSVCITSNCPGDSSDLVAGTSIFSVYCSGETPTAAAATTTTTPAAAPSSTVTVTAISTVRTSGSPTRTMSGESLVAFIFAIIGWVISPIWSLH